MGIIELYDVKKSYKVAKRERSFLKQLLFHRYDEIVAVQGINLQIEVGEAVGIIGPNGAGKSTLIKMMVGILQPTAGTLYVNSKVPYKHRKQNAKNIGVVFGQRTQLWWDLPLEDTLKLHREMYEIPDAIYKRNIEKFDKTLGICSFWHQPVRQLSLGQRMKADLAVALLHDPKLLFLDEPTIGLDVMAKKQVRDFLKSINGDNVTIILTSHDLKDIEEICPRVIMVNHGSIVIDTSLSEIKAKVSEQKILVTFAEQPKSIPVLEGCKLVSQEGDTFIFQMDSLKCSFTDFFAAVGSKNGIENISVQSIDIDEIVRKMYAEDVQ
ncbi:ATP-binding cassette domain-containing protein [Hominifimenecus microfluidus]|mgnify:CR=1 FL=1|uniref:ATP-binding cassette domain-containing protein n=1 Tax=Hominifimenecus microfluidus TaxID=2885348 RepID=A0AAE3EBW7_9FIRM|nr:ATP-binding cassette domain-containing protein [Hominifimenecus microfluidus]MCC2231829.1 ATP-binding cassette domain-containing protein [Hominifimenecus microfluidus]